MPVWPSDRFSEVADWCGVASLLLTLVSLSLTIYLTVTATQIKQQFQRKGLLPEQQSAIDIHRERLEFLLENYDASAIAILGEVGSIEGTLNSMMTNLHKSEKASVNEALKIIRAYGGMPNKAKLEEVYSKMSTIATEMQYKVKELQWH